MPTIDPDLYQFLTLVLLVAAVILLLAVLATLGRIRKIVEEGGFRTESAPVAAAAYGAPLQGAPAATWAPAPARTSAPVTSAAPAGQPAPGRTAAVAPVGAATPAAAATAAEPQGQPFEREGRWWFRRGDELLVFDEQSQQWAPAPAPAPAPGAAAAATVTPPADAGNFWKCPTCGAINGSTAVSCRMCFSARP